MIGDRWGVTDDEIARRYPCDDVVPIPALQAWRGVSVQAPAHAVWAWIGQLRLAPYSYDWIDNLGRRSPHTLHHLPDPVAGDHFTTCAGRRLGRVISVVPEKQLTATIIGAVMSYVLVPQGGSTRLLVKIVMARGRLVAPAVSVGDLIMARRQLLNLGRLAESTHQGAAP